MDEALGQEDARLLVTLQGGPVVVPADAGVFAQVAGRALEGQSVTLEDHLAQGRDEVVRVQLQGPFCGGGHQGSEARVQQRARCRGQGRGVQSQEWSCTGAHCGWGVGGKGQEKASGDKSTRRGREGLGQAKKSTPVAAHLSPQEVGPGANTKQQPQRKFRNS